MSIGNSIRNFNIFDLNFLFYLYLDQIKPHYRSEGPRQGSCGVFGVFFILTRLLSTNYYGVSKRMRSGNDFGIILKYP